MDELRTKLKEKKFSEWFKDDHILLHIDSRKAGVAVPENLVNNPALTLKLSCNFQGATNFDASGITSYLRFAGNYFECILPWDAIWGMTSAKSEQQLWPEDIPPELVAELAKAKLKQFGAKLFGKKDKGEKQEIPKPKVDSPAEPKTPFLKRIK